MGSCPSVPDLLLAQEGEKLEGTESTRLFSFIAAGIQKAGKREVLSCDVVMAK